MRVESRCCWHQDQIDPGDCPYLRGGEEKLLFDRRRRFLERCLECPRFFEELHSPQGLSGELAEVLAFVPAEMAALRVQNQELAAQVVSRNREIKFLHEVGLVLQTSVDIDEVIAMSLTAVTAGKGFGINRAVLLLVDRERQNLRGHFAVGPREAEEAGRIWQEVEARDFTLREMAQLFFEQKMETERAKFRDLLALLSVPLARSDHLFVRTLNEQLSRHIPDLGREPGIDSEQARALGAGEMVLVPLVSKNRRIGLLLADNIINRRPIETEDLHSLETFALPVSFAIERATLYERLQEELGRVTEANRRLRDQQEQILRMEKMALVGKIASNIAHSIRNPLTIIGGFARSLGKSTPAGDPKRQYIESIVREVRRLEEVLREVLNYSESLHPTLDRWDLNQLITTVCAALRQDMEMNGVECRLELAPDLPQARIDYKQMSYCLRSLLNNALEAMPQGGRVEVRTALNDEQLLITLADNGPGMSPQTLQAVTSPFASTKEEGSGLGLPLCTRILQGFDAGLEIDSREGRGTVINIRLNLPKEVPHGAHSGG